MRSLVHERCCKTLQQCLINARMLEGAGPSGCRMMDLDQFNIQRNKPTQALSPTSCVQVSHSWALLLHLHLAIVLLQEHTGSLGVFLVLGTDIDS